MSKFLSSIFMGLLVITAQAQVKQTELPKDTVPFLGMVMVTFDVATPIVSLTSGGELQAFEAAAQVSIKQKYYPVVEFGFANVNKLSVNDIQYNGGGAFGRVGVDFNLIKKKEKSKPLNHLFLAGARLGVTNFNYSIKNIIVADGFWGGSETLSYDNLNATKVWFEVVAGVRVELSKHLYLGWSARNKNLISTDVPGSFYPWYIPGFGKNVKSNWGFNYLIGYRF